MNKLSAEVPAEKPKARRINDAAKALGISRSHFYELAKRGQVRFVKIGDATRVPESEIDRLAQEGCE